MKSLATDESPCTTQCLEEMKTGSLRFMREEENEDYLMDTDSHMWLNDRKNATTNHHQNEPTIIVVPGKGTPHSSIDLCEFPSKDSSLRQVRTFRGAMKRKRFLYRRSSTASTAPMNSFQLDGDETNDKLLQEEQEEQLQACSVPESERATVNREVQSTLPTTHDEALLHELFEVQTRRRDDLLPALLNAVHNRHWNQVLSLLEQEPSLAKQSVIMVVQGENSSALLLHLVCGIKETPVSVIDTLVTIHPNSLLEKDERAGRLPIHIAVVRDAFPEIVQYLCQASSKSLEVQDQEGNLPLHYAAMYGSAVVLQMLLMAYPQGCKIPNSRDRFPIHLVCARCYDTTPLPTRDLEALIQSYPGALLQLDRFGRTPLHLAANIQHPQWQVLQVLIEHAPQAILYKDKAQKIPLQCAKSGHHRSNDVVVSYLTEATNRERRLRRQASSWNPLSLGRHRNNSNKKETNDLYCCYG